MSRVGVQGAECERVPVWRVGHRCLAARLHAVHADEQAPTHPGSLLPHQNSPPIPCLCLPSCLRSAGPRIFIGKLTKETTEADVKEYFMRFGYVMDVYLPKSKDNKMVSGGVSTTLPRRPGWRCCVGDAHEGRRAATNTSPSQRTHAEAQLDPALLNIAQPNPTMAPSRSEPRLCLHLPSVPSPPLPPPLSRSTVGLGL